VRDRLRLLRRLRRLPRLRLLEYDESLDLEELEDEWECLEGIIYIPC